VDEGWAYLALESFEDVGLLADADQDAVRLLEKYGVESRRRFRDAVISHAIPWCVAAVPGPKWAALVLGDEARTEDLWAVMQSILMLDRDDPAAAWRDKSRILTERSAYLNGLDLDALRFEDEGTDLTVGLLPNARWVGGPKHIGGRPNMANIPTEEVFTTPDRRRCDGHVRVTRPVEVRGTVIRGAELRFQDGQLADYRIEDGIEAFRGFLGTDAGAVRRGEVALVGEDSPIAASGLNFGSILYDENASCHIALGSGYASCLENADELTDDAAKEAAGCNASLVHRDFMIGSPTMNVTGRLRDGSSVPLLRDGRVVF